MAQSPSEDRQIHMLDLPQDPNIFLAAALKEKRTEHRRESQRKRQRREEGQRRGIGQRRKELPFHSFQREEGEKHNHDDSDAKGDWPGHFARRLQNEDPLVSRDLARG